MNKTTIASAALIIALGAATPTFSYADPPVPGENATTTTTTTGEKSSDTMGAAKGCAAGAVAGFVIPGLGNIIGCAVGGLVGWFW